MLRGPSPMAAFHTGLPLADSFIGWSVRCPLTSDPQKHVEEQAVARRQRDGDVPAGVASPSAPVFRVGPVPVRADLLPP